MGKAGSAKQPVTDYYMSQHWGISTTVDALLGIYVGEKVAWEDEVGADPHAIQINVPELFGGVKKEGGLRGTAYWLPGGPDQVLPEYLATKLGRTTATAPGYRGVASLWFHGRSSSVFNPSDGIGIIIGALLGGVVSQQGFLWSSNNPYLRDIWMKVRRRPKGLAEYLALIGPDANPIHIIYECMTNTDWGMGGAPSSFNAANFAAAAQMLFDEGMGMSLVWTKQSTVEAFVGEVIDHIQATIFINPRDGLWTIKLIRGDYDVDDLPVLNRNNCEIVNFDRKGWGETTNEIVCTWTNPENEQEETVVAQDLANITIQGAVISDSRNYYGFRNADLAMQVAKRDLRMASAPMAILELEVSRDAWDFVPGGVLLLDYPEDDYDINQLVLRISKIDYGKPGDPTIKLWTIEDIFALPVGAYNSPPTSEWQDPAETPRPLDFARVITAPLYFVNEALAATSITGFEFPEVMTMVLGAQDSQDTSTFELIAEILLPNGELALENFGTMSLVGHSHSETALAAEAVSLIPSFPDLVGPLGPDLNQFVFIGDGDDSEMEIALIRSADEFGWTVDRGVLDTVPRTWPIGTPMWLLVVSSDIIDESSHSGGETVNYKLLPRTSKGVLAVEDAPWETAVLNNRPWLPNPPGDVKLDGIGFGPVELGSATSTTITWANRNRLMEPTTVTKWTDGSITPEVGQTTTVTLMDADRVLIATHAGLTGTSYVLDLDDFGPDEIGIIRVTSERDDLESLQGHEFVITRD